MFDSAASEYLSADGHLGASGDIIDEIIWRSNLPEAVRSAPLTYVNTRVVDAQEIERLTDERLNPGRCPELSERLQVRQEALSKVKGQEITCAMVRLPGCSYTVEIDVTAMQIVHWEYQRL